MKKILLVILTMVIVVSSLPLGFISVAAAEFAGGAGTEENPYLISNEDQLDNVRNYLDSYFKLTADITMNTDNWEPIGTKTAPFTGTFDGDGHKIINLKVNISSENETVYAGLFGYCTGNINKIGIESGTVSAKSVTAYAGGIVGYSDGIISNCYNKCIVLATGKYAVSGGIAGEAKQKIIACYNTGSVSAKAVNADDITYSYAGGLVGMVGNFVLIQDCYNRGSISATSENTDKKSYAGGIVGHIRSSQIKCCYNAGTVTAEYYEGGIAGHSGASFKNCYFIDTDENASGNIDMNSKAVKCTADKLKIKSTFTGFDFNLQKVWTNSDGKSMPELNVVLDKYIKYSMYTESFGTIKYFAEKTKISEYGQDVDFFVCDNSELKSDDDLLGTGMDLYIVTTYPERQFSTRCSVVIYGDVNGDGRVTTVDYIRIKRYMSNPDLLTGLFFTAADINCDGKIQTNDYMKIKRHFMGTYNLYENVSLG